MGAKFFTGNFSPKLDEKGRLFLPAKFRVLLTEDVMVSPGQEYCLNVWSMEGFEAMTQDLQRKSQADLATRDHIRFLFSQSSEIQPDKQGRIGIPATLRAWAGLERDVVVIGVMNRLEVWEPTRWEDYSTGAQDKYADLDDPAPA